LQAARTRPPRFAELETAGEAYARALGRLETIVNQARDYYEQGNYKDDGFAKGKALHPGLLAAWDEFRLAHRALNDEVVRLNDELEQAELARLDKAAGQRLTYLARKMLLEAKQLVRAGSVADASGLELAEFRPRLEAYEASVDALKAYAAAHAEEAKGVSRLELVIDSASRTLVGAKELMRRKRDNLKYNDSDRVLIGANHAELVSGHPAQLMGRYNDLAERANDLRWR